ncbi:unnamed protein product [Acanthoscelides obtectus]|uniref:Uncharacterized protein n=1 Tax=Acanthoscelides obtectus TaxID=200917 RepID=A0A9P0PZ70_ACAOB|nr:unnamed protein product [Acanthoscelides obtectus]CAK1643947.1 hypothetical protein AOBTE_LOCUS13734 [Acanthoscelides obtectus]
MNIAAYNATAKPRCNRVSFSFNSSPELEQASYCSTPHNSLYCSLKQLTLREVLLLKTPTGRQAYLNNLNEMQPN